MKRPKLWTIICTCIFWLTLTQETESIKATSLIFAKTSTTTSTETSQATNEEGAETNTTVSAQEGNGSTNDTVTKPPLTGIPQIDYIWDPNLPRELNGYNLTDYPFYATVPSSDEIDFKCDGLHDGFYASVPHKCQVYHHCLYGTRYDFLCANFTAFDQKTFICHFVSEVDCVNSPKYFHRNDALYQAATTTTIAPPSTQPPTTTTKTTQAPPTRPANNHRRRRPYRRRRPEYDYYEDEAEYADDYYDDVPARNKGRKNRPQRPRRPISEYEYDEEYDTRYDRRGAYDRRRPSDERRRPSEDRRRPVETPRRPVDDDRRRPIDDRKRPYDNRRPYASDEDSVEERRTFDDRRRPISEDYDRRPAYNDRKSQRRPIMDDEEDYIQDQPPRKTMQNENRHNQEPRTPIQIQPTGVSAIYSQPRSPPIIRPPVPINERNKYSYKTAIATTPKPEIPISKDDEYYDDYDVEPTAPARKVIEESKSRFSPSPTRSQPSTTSSSPKRYSNFNRRPSGNQEPATASSYDTTARTSSFQSRKPVDFDSYEEEDPVINSRQKSLVKRKPPYENKNRPPVKRRPVLYDEESYEDDKPKSVETVTRFRKRPTTSPRNRPAKVTSTERIVQSEEEYYDDNYEYEADKPQQSSRFNDNQKPDKNQEPNIADARVKNETFPKREPYVKILKRPFLPSRGGNPLAARGLLPVGNRAVNQTTTTKKPTTTSTTTTTTIQPDEQEYDQDYIISGEEPSSRDRLEPDSSYMDFGSPHQETPQEAAKMNHQDYDYISQSEETSHSSETNTNKPNPIRINLRGNFNVGHNAYKYDTNSKPEPNGQPNSNVDYKNPQQPSDLNDQTKENVPQSRGPYQRPINSYQNQYRIPAETTTQKPIKQTSQSYRNPLDIPEEEYDVTLNDALNPTLPNLPNRNPPSGFILPRDPDYSFGNYQRSRYVNYDPISQASTDFTYQVEQPHHNGGVHRGTSHPSQSPFLTSQQNYNNRQRTQYIHF